MTDCLFCRIAAGAIPTEMEFEDDLVMAFRDLNPQAPTHLLIVPRVHIASAAELNRDHDAVWSRMLEAAQSLARSESIAGVGYRLVINVGREGGQTIDHLHLHLIGGRQMNWPPG